MLKQKEGSTTILVVLLVSVLVPLFIYLIAEIGQLQYVHNKMSFAAEQSARAGVWSIDEEKLSDGQIVINEKLAKEHAEHLIFGAIDSLNNAFATKPVVEVNVLAEGNEGSLESNGKVIKTNHPYVQIKADYAVGGFITEQFFPLSKEEVYEIRFMQDKQLPKISQGDSVVQWSSIVNPYRGYEEISFPISVESSGIELLGGTNNHMQITTPIHSGTYEISFDNGVSTILSGSIGETGGFEFKIPKKLPEDTNLFLKLKLFIEKKAEETSDSNSHSQSSIGEVALDGNLVLLPTSYDEPVLIGSVKKDIGDVLEVESYLMKEGN